MKDWSDYHSGDEFLPGSPYYQETHWDEFNDSWCHVLKTLDEHGIDYNLEEDEDCDEDQGVSWKTVVFKYQDVSLPSTAHQEVGMIVSEIESEELHGEAFSTKFLQEIEKLCAF